MNQPFEIISPNSAHIVERNVVPPMHILPESRHDLIGMIASKIASITTWTAKRAISNFRALCVDFH